MKVIFIEDDTLIAEIISRGLENENIQVYHTTTLTNIEDHISSSNPDLLILDLELGNINSAVKIPFLCHSFPNIPIVIASSHTDDETIAQCLQNGAAYFIKKPYKIKEIIAVINMLCIKHEQNESIDHIGKYKLDHNQHILIAPNGGEKKLNPKEYALLCKLLKNHHQIVTRKEILQKIWENEYADESLNNYISYLRKALSQDLTIKIQNIKSLGYELSFPT